MQITTLRFQFIIGKFPTFFLHDIEKSMHAIEHLWCYSPAYFVAAASVSS